MSTIGQRLAEERDRLGLNQTDFAAIGGVGRASQTNYETDRRSPDAAYLAAIGATGADIQYIVTGRRCAGSTPVDTSTERARAARILLEEVKERLERMVSLIA